jgi:hypothetical protein
MNQAEPRWGGFLDLVDDVSEEEEEKANEYEWDCHGRQPLPLPISWGQGEGEAMAGNRCRFQSRGVREKARAETLLLVNREKGLL